MRPKTISASSLANAQDCMLKFEKVNLEFVPEIGPKSAANVGTACHYALEHYVRIVYIEKSAPASLDLLIELYEEGYAVTFGTFDSMHSEYEDGLQLVKNWFARTDLSNVEVLSVEQKRRTPVPSAAYDKNSPAHQQPHPNAAVVPLSYIWDRADRYVDPVDGKVTIRITDYKSIRRFPKPEELPHKLQMQIYALCAYIYFKDEMPDVIRVELDLLRGEGHPIGAVFTVEQVRRIWVDLRKELQRILDTKKAEPKLGPGCKYCPVAPTCPLIKKNIKGGGLFSMELEEQLALRAEIQAQKETQENLLKQLDAQIIQKAMDTDELEFEVGNYRVAIDMRKRRKPDQSRFQRVLGAELYMQNAPMTMKKYDALMKSEFLTEEQREKMEECFVVEYSDPSIAISASQDVN